VQDVIRASLLQQSSQCACIRHRTSGPVTHQDVRARCLDTARMCPAPAVDQDIGLHAIALQVLQELHEPRFRSASV